MNDSDDAVTTRRLLWFMLGRLVVATLLLGATLWQGLEGQVGDISFTPLMLSSLIAATYAASLLFAVLLQLGGSVRAHGVAHLIFDLLLTSVIVYLTGGISSAFVSVYGVQVLMAAMILSPSVTIVTALVSVGLYLSVGIGTAVGWWPAPPDQSFELFEWQRGSSALVVVRSAVALIAVSVLASTLAFRIRTTGGALARVEEQAEKLVHLNDRIVRTIASGIITTDATGLIQTLNPAAVRILAADENDLVGESVDRYIQGDPELASTRAQALGYRHSGEAFPVGYSRTELIGPAGNHEGFLITFQDLTEIEALRDQAQAAERLATLGRLAAGLAHEIRNPLSSISGSVELVAGSPELSDEDKKLLSMVLEESERLANLVSTMLDVAQPREPARTKIELQRILEEVATMASRGFGAASGVDIEVGEANNRIFVLADEGQVRQVVWNLVKNAVQASERGQRVVLSCKERSGEAILEVTDHGSGIAESARNRLFDAFYSGRPQGVGIGLALVQQIVRAHDGKINFDSEPGVGTTFRVVFPIHRSSSAPPPSSHRPQSSASFHKV